jgi:Glycosyl hydrolases family 38 N-terminal domain/Glycosyl hydrolases family 38 C-terminal domain
MNPVKRGIFSARVALPEARGRDEPRDELRSGITGVKVERAGLIVLAGDVPLFRRRVDGDLEQCVRIVLHAVAERGPVRIGLRDGERLLDEASVDVGQGKQVVRLFAPEGTGRVVLELDGDAQTELQIRPQRKWRVFLIHHSHLDIGYTDRQALVLRHHLSYLDSALELADREDGFRWNIEANWPLEHWLHARPGRAANAMLERLREGRFEACAMPYTLHAEALSVDELARQLFFAAELREHHGIPVVTAMQTDAPGAPAGLPGLLADAGVRYLSVAHNYAERAAPYLTGGQQLPRAFWWRSESGKRVLVWHTDSPHGIAYLEGNLLGLAESFHDSLDLLPQYLAALATRGYPYTSEVLGLPTDLEITRSPYPYDVLHLRVQGTQADNAAPSLQPAAIANAWNQQFAYPELRPATNAEFFSEAEKLDLETFTGDWPDWWMDGLGSAARAVGFNRRAQGTIRTAQTLHVLADALAGPGPGWRQEADAAYASMGLFDEHTWGAAHPEGDAAEGRESGALQWQAKAAYAAEARDRSDAMREAAIGRLAELADGVLVFNPSSRARTDVVRLFVPAGRVPLERPLVVRGPAGEPLACASEIVAGSRNRNRAPGRTLSFVADDVPAMGFRRYTLAEETMGGDVEGALENEHYRLELDAGTGCLTSVFDKGLGLELVQPDSAFGFGQVVYDRYSSALRATQRLRGEGMGAGGDRRFARSSTLLSTRSAAGYGVVTERISTAVEQRITVRLVAEGTSHVEATFGLVHGVPRVDASYRLFKLAVEEKEGVYIVFPFGVSSPTIEYELAGAVGSPIGARVPGGAGHVNAIRHWASLQDAQATVAWATLDAPLLQIGDIALPYPPYPPTFEQPEPGTLVSWVMNNMWDTNFPLTQSGETHLAYAVSSAPPAADARALGMRTGAALSQPLVAVLGGTHGANAMDDTGCFCTLDRDDVEVVALTGSRRDHDFVALIQSFAPEEVEVRVAFPDLVVERVLCGTFLEDRLTSVADGRVRIGPGNLVAVAVDLR